VFVIYIVSKDEQISQLKSQKAQLEFENAQLKRLIYGAKSERYKSEEVPAEQLNLFVSPQEEQEEVKEVVEQITYERKKGSKPHKGRNELPSHLPVKEVIIEPEVDTTNMVKIGEQITETLDYTPASLIKVVTIRPKYVAKEEQVDQTNGATIVIAPAPNRPIDKAIAEAGLLAYIIVCKFVDHLPFYRLIQIFKREFKWEPSKSTINDWFVAVCTLLEPLYEALETQMLHSAYLHGDESPIKVQDNNKNGTTHLGYQWVYLSPSAQLVMFQYHRSRSIQAPKELLKNYKGYLQCDGYAVYDKLERLLPDISLVGCWIHARRKYHEALQNDEKRSTHVLNIFKKIYQHEAECRSYTPIDRKDYRDQHIKPLLESIKAWIEQESIKVPPKSAIGKAMAYTQNQWPKLIKVLEDGKLQLDNNDIENKIRPLAIGRKNYLFAGSHPAAQRIAMMYSFFASCKLNNVNPQEWLVNTLNNIKDTKRSQLHTLLPNYKFTESE
jgi:transposase